MRSVIVVLLACVGAVVLSGSPAHTQPAPDLDRARVLYASAEKALAEDRLEDALKEYKAAFEITRDPALLYKLGVAHQKANECRPAVAHFAAYLRIGKPTPDFFALTREKIRVCGYDPDGLPADLEDPTVVKPVETGSGSGSGSDVPVAVGSGSAAPPPPTKQVKGRHRAAWILVGGAIAAATVGAVLAYSANAAEADVDDLYVGLGGTPPVFDASTQKRFDDLVDEGKRDQKLSWASFGVAAVLGGLAAWRFTVKEETVQVTPTVTPNGASVTAGFRF